MEFTAIEDIEAPIEAVFKAVSDFDGFERAALRRGAKVRRVERPGKTQMLMAWDIEAKLRGKMRLIKTDLIEMDAPNNLSFVSVTGGMMADAAVELVALSRNRTRLNVSMALKSKSLTARLLLQTMRLAKGKISKAYVKKVAHFATDVETRYKSGQLA